jgi:hypothetical protein
MRSKMKRPRPMDAVACIALFFALAGGTAVALAGRNTVDSGDIKPKQVKTSDIANNAVTTRKVKNNAVRTADVQNGQIKPADLAATEPVHKVGTPGEPPFGNGGEGDCIWAAPTTLGSIRPNPMGFYKDAYGMVHLLGVATATDAAPGDGMCGGAGAETNEDAVAFVLPPGYRPARDELLVQGTDLVVIIGNTPLDTGPGGIVPAGAVYADNNVVVGDGFTFRAAGPGTGLPRRAQSEGSTRSILDAVRRLTH